MSSPRGTRRLFSAIAAAAASAALQAGLTTEGVRGQVPTPTDQFGFPMGAERRLANWDDLTAYYEVLAHTSDRVAVDTLGPTTRGRPFVMLTITSPANHARLTELHGIQRRLSDPRTIAGDDDLERLLAEGRTIVMITHAIHSTEVGSAQSAARLAHHLASSQDERVRDILDNVILLQIPSLNPDGTQWVNDFYNEHVDTDFEGRAPPWLYHFYTGHDNNRDWYTFYQNETQHTVRAQNEWHPQIVHDIHQMGGSGARIFFPPYIDPIEPNVDPGLVTAVNQLGAYMAAELTSQGKKGVVINAIYDGFHPGRAYMHYHGGARILSETASAQLASSVNVPREVVQGGREYDAGQAAWNFPWPWRGGEWGLPDIVEYQFSGAMALLTNAARNRRFWLENFYRVNERAVAGWDSWPTAWVIPAGQENEVGVRSVLRILTVGDVEVHRAETAFTTDGATWPAGSWVVPMRQPNAAFAQTLLVEQEYPDLREFPGGPPKRPYDVTAHTLPLLMGIEAHAVEAAPEVALGDPIPVQSVDYVLPEALSGSAAPRVGMYKGHQEPMIAGWTRWMLDRHGMRYDSLHDARIRAGSLADDYDVLIFQSQSDRSISEGHPAGFLPEEYTGGLGEDGRAAVRDFVESGGRLIVMEEAADFAASVFGLGIGNAVEGLSNTDFYVPGSILRVDLTPDPLSSGYDGSTAAWYWRSSRAFTVDDDRVEVLGTYGQEDPAIAGWILGPERLAGQPALLRARVGDGEVILFGFQPNYRGQSIVTWPLIFNAIAGGRLIG
ncbi:MAG: M14 family zinc carboxypeptidase [Gemmatimonadota bacterium]|nr:M14 family zinc carboxypeptidase [Gemmatimonadota bacterium]MDE2864607.1 M14 family zinc carboxypeptidase [Gemmatimonadota bacterium]